MERTDELLLKVLEVNAEVLNAALILQHAANKTKLHDVERQAATYLVRNALEVKAKLVAARAALANSPPDSMP
jgi:hypothetical protein